MKQNEKLLLYNKILNMEILIESLLQELISKDIIDEKKFEQTVRSNMQKIQNELESFKHSVDTQSTVDVDKPDLPLDTLWGKGGDA